MNKKFDKKELFEEKCRPSLTNLVQECQLLKIPFFWAACVKNGPEGSEYINDGVLCGSNNITLTDDKITKYLLVASGLETVKIYEDPTEIVFNEEEELTDDDFA